MKPNLSRLRKKVVATNLFLEFAASACRVFDMMAGITFESHPAKYLSVAACGHELNAIAAAVVGGCSLQGGIGTVTGTILGALFLRIVIDSVSKIIKSGADIWEGLIVGIVVVLAVTFSQLQQLRGSGKRLFPGALGVCAMITLSLFAGLIAMSTRGEKQAAITMISVLAALFVYGLTEKQKTRG